MLQFQDDRAILKFYSVDSWKSPSAIQKFRANLFLVALLTEWPPFRPPGYCSASTTVREPTRSLQIAKQFNAYGPHSISNMVSISTEKSAEGIVNIESRPLRRTVFVEPESGPADSCSSTHGDSLDPSKAGDESIRGSARRNSRRTQC